MNRNGGEVPRTYGKSRIGETSHQREATSPIGTGAMRAGAENTGAAFLSGQERITGVVSRYPFSATATCFTVGLAVGVMIGLLVTEPPQLRWYEKVPDSFGRRWLESLLSALPDSVRTRVS